MSPQPILSICIPTYNRCDVLESVLNRYLRNPEFDDDVEIVISDNASTDNTESVCRKFAAKNSRIIYFRNETNLHDLNFVKVLDGASGKYLKLFNDWAYCPEESLRFVKDTIRDHVNTLIPLFFTSGFLYTPIESDITECKSLDEYVKVVSTMVTSIAMFGVWKSQWNEVRDKERYAAFQLLQVDWTYQIVSNYNKCLILNQNIFEVTYIPLGVRKGYNWFKIHIDNYYKIMLPYIDRGFISCKTYACDRKNLLRHFRRELGLAIIYNYSDYWRFDTSGTLKLLWKYYKKDYYFYKYMITLPFYYFRDLLTSFFCKIKKIV